MSAAGAHAFEGPAALMSRLTGARATAMHGAGGQAGTEEKMQTALTKDASATECGDATWQLEVRSHPTGIGAVEPDRKGSGTVSVSVTQGKAGGLMSAVKSMAVEAMPASMKPGGGGSAPGGGQLTQTASGCPFMTSMFGMPAQDTTHTLKIAGHPLIADGVAMEKQQTFNRAKTLERAVHACGSGAFGYFVTTADCSAWTKAALFQGVGTRTPVGARFSTTTYGREFPDEARNPRGLAFKFYTSEGNYDIMSVNFPAFFVRDGALGPDAIRSQQRNPQNFQVSFDSTLDFMSLVPESMLANLWYWSDHGTPRGWMHMDGYPIHAFKGVNAKGDVTYFKYRLVSAQGVENLSQAEAQRVSGIDPDFSKREMWQHIQAGGTAEWIVQVQLVTPEQLTQFTVSPFDCSKPWPESHFPFKEIGRIVLDKNPENYHRDIEQIAFSPGRMVPGIEPTPDPLLQFRCWLYVDAQLHRLGTNYHQIPVNTPWMADSYHPLSRDGVMRVDTNGGHEPHYYPNSMPHKATATTTSASTQAPGALAPVPDVSTNWAIEPQPNGAVMSRGPNSNTEGHPEADYLPACDFWLNGLSATDKAALCSNVAYALRAVSRKEVVIRWLLACHRTHPTFMTGVVEALQAECDRCKKPMPVSADELTQCIKEMAGKPLVDSMNGYLPTPLSI